MFKFETKTGASVDVEAVEQVMFGERKGVWCLDIQNGTVKKTTPDTTHVRISRFTQQEIEQVMRDFITESSVFIFDEEDEKLTHSLLKVLEGGNVIHNALKILQTSDAWMSGWLQWRSDAFWEEIKAWLFNTIPDLTEAFELNCSCSMCHALAKNIELSNSTIRIDWNLENINLSPE